MSARWLWLVAALAIGGCGDDDGDDGATPGTDAGTGGAGGGAGGGGGGGPGGGDFDCAALCDVFETSCNDAFLVREGCDDCAGIAAGLGGTDHPETYARSAALCEIGIGQDDCAALYACFSDKDGLSAAGGNARVTVSGMLGAAAIDLATDDAWAFVGTKNDGQPGDLEGAFFADGRLYVLRFDDLALGAALSPLDAADHSVELESVDEKLTFKVGEIRVDRFETGGGFAVTADVGVVGTTGVVTIQFEGEFD